MMPGEIGQSPAAALQYRRGDLEVGEVVIRQITSKADVLGLRSAALREGRNSDFRISQAPGADQPDQIAGFDPLSFFVGRVERTLDAKANPVAIDLSKFIDRDKKTITSSTGQVVWRYGQGIVIVNSPRSQGAAGFLGRAGPIKLGDVTIESRNEYTAIQVVSLDGQPLSSSRKILVIRPSPRKK